MKSTSFFQSILVIAATLLLLWAALGCSSQQPNPNEAGTPVEISAKFAGQTNDFAFEFFKQLNAQPAQTDKNVFVSPLSLHTALGMLLNGANGKTVDEIQQTLKLSGISMSEANQAYQQLMEGLPKADPKVTLGLANSVWYRNTFQPETDFLNTMKTWFKSDVNQFTGSDATPLNQWASDKTNGKIKKVLDNIDPQMVLFLMNALYFKGDWKISFDEKKTGDYPFQLGNGQTKEVKMMQLEEKLRLGSRNGYFAYELPYGNGQYTMTVLVPQEGSNVADLVKTLNATEWVALQQAMRETPKTKIGLPKFTLEYEIRLNEILQQMGMPTAFIPGVADLTKINKNGNLNVGFVKQNTFVAIDEKGTEAAAVTTIGIELTSIGQTYYADRPFVFIISEKTSNTILFMGKMMNP
ncbi:MAG: serpin family protein [Spirosomataceae bacterium]